MTAPQDPFGPPGDRRPDDRPAPSPHDEAPGQGYGAPPGQQPYGQQPWGQQHPSGAKRNGLGVAALVVGLVALVLSWTVFGGIVLGLVAVVLGVLGRGRVKRGEADNSAVAIAGLVLGVVSILIAGAVIAAGVAFFTSDSGQTLFDCLEDAGSDPAAQEQCQRELQDSVEQ